MTWKTGHCFPGGLGKGGSAGGVIGREKGEGGSGGALGIGVADKVLMMENAYYSVISPEGCAAILWKHRKHAPEAAEAMKIAAPDLAKLGLIDGVIPEVAGGAHHDPDAAAEALRDIVFKNLNEHTNENAILASNTSGLDVDAIASVTKRPDKVVGTHFFSPANIMRLLEVVRGEQTSHETLASVMTVSKKIKKAAVVSLNAPGFIGNRMLFNYTAQANMLLLEGALPHQIDQAIESFGLNMGPFRMMDLVGLDLGWRARKLSGVESPLHAKIGDYLCDNDRFGQKNGKGYYNYSEGSRAPNPAPENEEVYEKISAENGFTRREISDEEITDRCILALINEGADILSEGVAQRAADIDVVYINGYGFPIWRGGPMHHANAMGLDVVVDKLKKYHEITGNDAYKPSELLIKLAQSGEKLNVAPSGDDRKEKLNFAMSSVAGNF